MIMATDHLYEKNHARNCLAWDIVMLDADVQPGAGEQMLFPSRVCTGLYVAILWYNKRRIPLNSAIQFSARRLCYRSRFPLVSPPLSKERFLMQRIPLSNCSDCARVDDVDYTVFRHFAPARLSAGDQPPTPTPNRVARSVRPMPANPAPVFGSSLRLKPLM